MNQTPPQRVEGFDSIIFAPNECKFAYERRGVDYRGPADGYWTAQWWLPEPVKDNYVEWRTATCPIKGDTVFSFAGASSVIPTAIARGPQARLYVNDEYVLTFDLGLYRNRTWKAGEWQLRYNALHVEWPYTDYQRRYEMVGQSGLYELKAPARALEAGQPCRLKVEMIPFPRWERAWFMVKKRGDTLGDHDREELHALRNEVNRLKQMVHILATEQYPEMQGREKLQNRVAYTNGYKHLLSPDFAKLGNGDWLLCFREGAEHTSVDGDVVILKSRDEGESWEELSRIANEHNLDEREGGIIELPGGRIVCNVFYNRMYDERGEYMDASYLDTGLLGMYSVVSDDGGRTWSEPSFLDVSKLHFTDIEGPASPPIALPDGTLLQVLTAYNIYGDAKGSAIVVFESRDGLNWTLRSTVGEDKDGNLGGLWEASIVRCDSGRIVCAIRNEGPIEGTLMQRMEEEGWTFSEATRNEGGAQVLWTALSDDDGRTWHSLQASEMVGHPPDLIKLHSGAILCTYGYRPENHGEPAGIRACVSYDEGASWDMDNEIIIRQDFLNFDIGYPASLQRTDGRIVTVYYCNMFGRFFEATTTWDLPAPAR